MIKALDKISHQLSPLEIVLINTSAGERYGKDDYVTTGCGILWYAASRLKLKRPLPAGLGLSRF